jgi:hypothetical protein
VKRRYPSRWPQRLFALRDSNRELWVRSWKSEYMRVRKTVATRPRAIATAALGRIKAASAHTAR